MSHGTARAAIAARHEGTRHNPATKGEAEKYARRRREALRIVAGRVNRKSPAGTR
jgi:hypothetical protein